MTKNELVEALQKELGLESKAEATRTLDAVGAVYLKGKLYNLLIKKRLIFLTVLNGAK